MKMKVQLKENVGGSTSKLACVKKIRELTGLGLKEAKELVDSSRMELVEVEISEGRGEVERLKPMFREWGYTLTGGRSEALDDLLGDIYKYVIEFLHRDVTYRIEEGDLKVIDGRYEITVELGVKIDDNGENTINMRKIILPMDAVSIEENIL